jgi:hypothetical protein
VLLAGKLLLQVAHLVGTGCGTALRAGPIGIDGSSAIHTFALHRHSARLDRVLMRTRHGHLLIAHLRLSLRDRSVLVNRSGSMRLGFAMLCALLIDGSRSHFCALVLGASVSHALFLDVLVLALALVRIDALHVFLLTGYNLIRLAQFIK